MTKTKVTLPRQRIIFTGIGLLLGALALLTPFWDVAEPASYIGGLLIWAAIVEIVHGFRRAENWSRKHPAHHTSRGFPGWHRPVWSIP